MAQGNLTVTIKVEVDEESFAKARRQLASLTGVAAGYTDGSVEPFHAADTEV